MHYTKAERNDLKLRHIQKRAPESSIHFEAMGDDLLLVTLELDLQRVGKPRNYYRLLGKEIDPPLEIGVDAEDDSIQSITAFLGAQAVAPEDAVCTHQETGVAIVDGEVFRKGGFGFIDKEIDYVWQQKDRDLICVFSPEPGTVTEVANQRIGLLFDEGLRLTGFRIQELRPQERQVLHRILGEQEHFAQ